MNEYLIYFPASNTALGVMPSHYEIVKSTEERTEALKYGGKDVSDSQDAWSEAEAIFAMENECLS